MWIPARNGKHRAHACQGQDLGDQALISRRIQIALISGEIEIRCIPIHLQLTQQAAGSAILDVYGGSGFLFEGTHRGFHSEPNTGSTVEGQGFPIPRR
jgi:hypothetical protein